MPNKMSSEFTFSPFSPEPIYSALNIMEQNENLF